MTVIPAFKTLKALPGQLFHFLGKTHAADENGLLHNVPHDQAVILIRNKSAVEHVEAAPVEVKPVEIEAPKIEAEDTTA